MSNNIDHSPIIRRDPGLVGASLDRLADQLRDGWSQARRVKLPPTYRNITSVALCGMGGSHLGVDILRSALIKQLRVPVTIIADYTLPGWVNHQTLVICSSYSGSTEESISALKAAHQRKLKIVVMAHGSALVTQAKKFHLPLFQFSDSENPSGQPRLGVAYTMMALISCFRQLGLVKITPDAIRRLEIVAWEATKRYSAKKPLQKNPAKQLASQLATRIPLLIGAEWTEGNLHSLNNQINENAKTAVMWHMIPALNHYLLEGLRNRKITKQVHALMILDRDYHPRNQRRIVLTTKILKQLGANVSTYIPHGTTTLEKAIDLLAFGGYVSWYMAAVRNVKPADIPTVKYLKQQLAKR